MTNNSNWKGRGDYERSEKRKNIFTCVWCGKHFRAKDKRIRRYCSEECKRNKLRAYNTAYVRKMRENNPEKRRSNVNYSKNYYAKQVWENWVAEADKIMKLIEDTATQGYDVRNSVAHYLSANYTHRQKKVSVDFSSIYSANTAKKKVEESIGDTIDKS